MVLGLIGGFLKSLGTAIYEATIKKAIDWAIRSPEEEQYIASHEAYVESPYELPSAYRSVFRSEVFDPDTGETEDIYFTIDHDDPLTEDDVYDIVSDFEDEASGRAIGGTIEFAYGLYAGE